VGEILVGTSGFSFDDWVGEVYPSSIKKQEMLPYYEKVLDFSALEVNYTYYSMPSRQTMESFARRTSSDFSFIVKAYKGMTHEKAENLKEQCRIFKDGISPLGRNLKAVLFQFPYMFVPGPSSVDHLKRLREEFDGYESVIEFRNAKWFDDRYLEVLRELTLGYCIVDEPKLKGLLPFYPALTSDTGYFRFHGRNTAWFSAPVDIRYDYLYSNEELEQFVGPVEKIGAKAKTTFAFFNNCHMGKAAKNAKTFKEMIRKAAHSS
jgi:uncharacterized protein YecE (DUF72 family)